MNRRRLISVSARSLLGVLASGTVLPASAAPEPTYTVTTPGNQTISLRIESTKAPDGRRKVRVWNLPNSTTKSDLYIDTNMVLEADGKPSSSRVFLGINPSEGMHLEAVRSSTGFTTREPALSGDLKFGAPLYVPLIAELFVGKMYDFKRGGSQTFAHLYYASGTNASISTMTLAAEGDWETLELLDGPAKGRKLRYQVSEPAIPEPDRSGVFYVGQQGEVLKCDKPLFGVPIQARGPAKWDDNRQVMVHYQSSGRRGPGAVVRAEKQAGGDWKISLNLEGQTEPLSMISCDPAYRLKRLDMKFRQRPFVARAVATDTVQWSLAAGPEQQTPVPTSSPVWLLPHWFATDTWEGPGGAFAAMTVGETREGVLLPLFLGQRDANTFALERLSDFVTRKADGSSLPLRHYRFYNGGKETAPVVSLPNNTATPNSGVFDFYTDGARLAVFLSNDGMRIVRSGWEKFAASLKPPAAKSEQASPAVSPDTAPPVPQ